MSHLDILLPFALPPAEMSADLFKALNAPALATLLARAKSEASSRTETFDEFHRMLPYEKWLAHTFCKAEGNSLPVAADWMRTFGFQPAEGTWFVVQPVHIHIARDHLVLIDPRHLALAEEESRRLFDIAKPLFEETGKDLLYGNATTWFVRADTWQELQTSTPDATSGHNIDIWMPSGPGERDWRKIQNEVQMHWFAHSVNFDRESQGKKPVNSIWLWGGATAGNKIPKSSYSHAYNFSNWMAALTMHVEKCGQADTASAVIAQKPQHALILLDTLLGPALSNDWSRWLDIMQELEQHWFAPLLNALKSGSIDRLSLIATNDSRLSKFTVTRSSLRKFWISPSLTPLAS